MNTADAIEICEAWFRYLDRQEAKSKKLAELASLARRGPEGAKLAQQEMRRMDRSLSVYDGARLRPAVEHLLKQLPKDNT